MDENLLRTLGLSVRRAYLHARKQGPVAQVLDTFEALGFETKQGQRPVLAHKHRTAAGWHLAFCLPAGIPSKDVLRHLDHFEEQAGCPIEVTVSGRILHMELGDLPERVEYTLPDEPTMAVPMPIGLGHKGMLTVDLATLPHVLVAGQTGYGKTTFLRGLVVSVLKSGARVVVIDLKGLDYHALAKSGHVLAAECEEDARRTLLALNRELDRRKCVLQAANATSPQGTDLPYIVAVIDELAELRERESQEAVNRLARLARAVGICVVAATQRPSHTLFARFTDTRMLFSGRLSFWMPKPEDSRLLLDSDAACRLPMVPGRAIWQFGRETQVQAMSCAAGDAQRLLRGIQGVIYEPGPPRLPAR